MKNFNSLGYSTIFVVKYISLKNIAKITVLNPLNIFQIGHTLQCLLSIIFAETYFFKWFLYIIFA